MDLIAERAKSLTPSLTLSITSQAKQMIADGQEVCSFGAGEPDFDTPEHVKEAAIEALNDGFTKYTPSSGTVELRTAVAEKLLLENNVEYDASQVIVSCGAKHSLFNTVMAVCDPGDEVIIPAPYWLSYPEMVRLAGAEPVFVHTLEENGWKITGEQFENAMSPRTKMIILNTPGNPTGAVYSKAELESLAEVAVSEDIVIVSDEIYEKLIYGDTEHVSIASLDDEVRDLTVTVNGVSKAYAMTGWRIGYLAAPEEIAVAVGALQSHSTSNPTSFAQVGALAAISGDQQAVTDMRDELDMRRSYMFRRLSAINNISVVEPKGAFYTLVNIGRTGLTSTNFCDRILSHKQVALIPGIAFGDDRTIRFSYATNLPTIKEGLDRFEDFCKSF